MSRIGKQEIKIPEKVEVKFNSKARKLTVSGPKGELHQKVNNGIEFDIDEKRIVVTRNIDNKSVRALHGLYRSLLNNMVIGVIQGFSKNLELHGVGFKAKSKGNIVIFDAGYSHKVEYQLPKGVTCKIVEETKIMLEGFDKQLIGEVAAQMRKIRPPEPYKKKGIRYAGEVIRGKAGKKSG